MEIWCVAWRSSWVERWQSRARRRVTWRRSVNGGENCLRIPAPLHRTRLWNCGFNQSALVARELSRRLGIAATPIALQRTRRTPPLKGMSPLQRRKTVTGAFRVRDEEAVAGKTTILVDDVFDHWQHRRGLRPLKRAGAARIEMVSWARGETFAVDALRRMPKYRLKDGS